MSKRRSSLRWRLKTVVAWREGLLRNVENTHAVDFRCFLQPQPCTYNGAETRQEPLRKGTGRVRQDYSLDLALARCDLEVKETFHLG
jgi:hypothetical protein